ncbi:MAG TPA: hypothetical protein VFF06_25855 [Polyangia bacterium]|nr:hypothetical protein [Polyangia bacterium]
MDPDLRLVLDAFARSADYYRTGATLFAIGAGAAAVGGGAAFALGADPVRAGCGLVLAALFGAIAFFSRVLARRYVDEERSPVLRALLHARDEIVLAQPQRIAANPRGLGITGREQHFVRIRLRDGAALGVRVERETQRALLDALARLAPKAEVDGRG